MKIKILLTILLFASVSAKVSSTEANELTPLGAIKAGNADGSIPAWDGGIKSPPAGYKVGDFHVDPFASDKVEFTITKANMGKYASKLTEGHKALLNAYPDSFKMNVYKSRRSASYPDFVIKAVEANGKTAKLANNGNGVNNATVSIPFPKPKSGIEVLWNHILRYRGSDLFRYEGRAVPTQSGAYTYYLSDQAVHLAYGKQGQSFEDLNNVFFYVHARIIEPPRLAGGQVLIHETLDQNKEPRKAWTYNPGQRRLRRAPNLAFDTPLGGTDGQKTFDQIDIFNGSPERYDFKLIGKKEMYVPYNAYKLHSGSIKYSDIIKPKHINMDLARYELHRVWVIEATLKPGKNHVYGKRTFYIDEDSWSIVAADHYDRRGNMWRIAEGHTINYYEVPTVNYTLDVLYDVQNGRYIADGLDNERAPYDHQTRRAKKDFTPAAVRRAGRR